MLICVYIPTNYGDLESYDDYIDTCSIIESLMIDADVSQVMIIGDFNCQPNSRFFSLVQQLAVDYNLCFSDMLHIKSTVTYYSDNGLGATSRIDHVLCSCDIHNVFKPVGVLNEHICSDHRPLSI